MLRIRTRHFCINCKTLATDPKKYTTILADPPWPVQDVWKGAIGRGGRRRNVTEMPYSLMSLDDIFALPVTDLAAVNAHLYLWVTADFNRKGVGVQCSEAWGFEVVSEIVWKKKNFGMGAFPRPQHEILLICRRGKLNYVPRDVGSVQTWSQPRAHNNGGKVHSAKPDGAIDLIERASPGPYLELFARRKRMGWDTWGDQIWQDVELAFNTST